MAARVDIIVLLLCLVLSSFVNCEEVKVRAIGAPRPILFQDDFGFVDDYEFVLLRMQRLMDKSPSDVTQLRALIDKERLTNSNLDRKWRTAESDYNRSKKAELQRAFANSPDVLNVPDEYHIAFMTYAGSGLSSQFNYDTRHLCWGSDVMKNYSYSAYAKLLHIALIDLGPKIAQHTRFNLGPQTLWRDAGPEFQLEIGQKIAFQQFTSTTWMNYSQSSMQMPETRSKTTNFVFKISDDHPLHYAAFVRYHSYSRLMDELLISPLELFKIVDKQDSRYAVTYTVETEPYTPGCNCQTDPPEFGIEDIPPSSPSTSTPHLAIGTFLLFTFLLAIILTTGCLVLLLHAKRRHQQEVRRPDTICMSHNNNDIQKTPSTFQPYVVFPANANNHYDLDPPPAYKK